MGKNATLKAVDDVSFEIYKGETLGMVGESGCGKTTCGRTCIGLYDKTDGTVLYKGKDVHAMTGKERFAFKKNVQMVFQDPYGSLDPRMTVADIMITDYSSVVFEYALFERPMAFFTYDLDEYIDERGLYYDFDEVTPGPLCTTNEELIDYIINIDTRFNKQEVIDFKEKFMSSCDGHSTERIWALVEEKQ